MADGLAVERLRQYLRELSPRARAMLSGELDRAQQRGDAAPANALVLRELHAIQATETAGTAEKAGAVAQPVVPVDDVKSDLPAPGEAAKESFFAGLAPFIVDDNAARKHLGQIAQSSLTPIWDWLSRDAMPDVVENFGAELGAAMAAENQDRCDRIARSFQDRVVSMIGQRLADAAEEKAQRKIAAQIGTPHALDELREIRAILSARDWLAALATKLPTNLRSFADEKVDKVKKAIDAQGCSENDLLYALLLVMARMETPWQLVRLAVRAASSDVDARIADTPYKVALSIVLNDTERMVHALRAELPQHSIESIQAHIKSIHDAVRGLRTEISATPDSRLGRSLAAIRSEVSATLKSELEQVPANVRRLLRPRVQKDGATLPIAVDLHDVVEVELQLDLVMVCKNYAGELALSETMLRTFSELQQYLEQNTQSLLDGLRLASDGERPFRQSQIDAAVRFCAKIFGQQYAALLSKAADLAARDEKRVQRA